MTSPDIMVLIPAFNEALAIENVVAGCRKWGLCVVVVDDGSSDSTADEARRAGAIIVVHSGNQGKGKALATGFDYASRNGFKAVITLDADGQHDPGEIGLFLDEYNLNGADIIVGTRMHDVRRMPWLRRLTNRASSFAISKITGCRVTDSQCGFRLITVRAWRGTNLKGARFDAESEILLKAPRRAFVVKEVPIRTIYRDQKSEISPWLDTWGFIKVAVAAMLGSGR